LLISANLFGSHWRPVFWVNVPIGLVTLALAVRLVPETRAPQAHRLDLPGVAVLTIALALLVVPLIEGRQAGWPLWAWLSLAASVAAFAAFAVVERQVEARGGAPLVALHLFSRRPFLVGIGLVLATYAGLNSFFLVLSLALQDGLGLSALSAGLIYTPEAVTFFAVSLLAGRLAPRYGRTLLEAGGIVLAIGYGATALTAALAGSSLTGPEIIPSLVIQGVGGGLLLTPLLNAILSRMGPAEVGQASGVLSTTQQVGGSLGIAVIGVLFFDALGHAAHRATGSYAHALAVGVLFNLVVAAAGAALVFALPTAPAAEPPG
jgi:MFS family permease